MSEVHEAVSFRWRRWIVPLLTLGIFAAVLGVIHRELAHFHLRDVLAHLGEIPPMAVFAAVGCMIASYLLLGAFDVMGLRYAGKPLPYGRVAFTSFVAYAIGHSLGAAALTAGAVRYRLYSAARLSGVEVATLQGFCSLTTAIGLCVLIGVSLVTVPHHAVSALHLFVPWSTLIGAVLLAAIAAYAAWGSLAREGFELRGWSLRPPGPWLVSLQLILGTLELCVAASVLWWLLPPEADVGLITFLGVYALAVTAGIVSHVPGGLGVFESMILIALPHAPADAVLGALLAYRAIYYLLPLLVAGLAFAAREIRVQSPRLASLEALIAAYIAPLAPQIIGALVFVAGVVLLVSGATPGVNSRLMTLRHLVPLPILETSQLVGSVAGLGLLVLSRALFRRVHEGYRLTVWLLWAGIVASILKGLDFEEAMLLALVLIVLWLGRRAFHRRASIIKERFTPVWVVSIAGVLGAAIWIGFFAHRHVEYSSDLWWTFAVSADAPRMLRASLVAVLAAGAFLAANLLRPGRPEPELPTVTELERAQRVIECANATLANAALAADKRLLFSSQGDAFIMYQVVRRSWVALGDPVGARERHEELVWRFRELSDRHGGWAVFYQVSGDKLPLYVDLGLTPVKIGEEARVPLQSFGLEGSARADLRQARRRAERDGASFEVIDAAALEAMMPALRRISDAWLEEKATGEKGFSIGAFREDYIRRFPVAIVRCEGQPVAFANLWTTGTKEELSVDLMRFSADAPRSAMDYLFIELMLWGRQQGYRWFNLGTAPLAGLEEHPLAPSWHRIGNFVFRHGEHFYNFDGLRHYKSKFAPAWEPKYLMAPGGLLVLPRVLMDVSVLIAGGVKELLSK